MASSCSIAVVVLSSGGDAAQSWLICCSPSASRDVPQKMHFHMSLPAPLFSLQNTFKHLRLSSSCAVWSRKPCGQVYNTACTGVHWFFCYFQELRGIHQSRDYAVNPFSSLWHCWQRGLSIILRDESRNNTSEILS